MYKVQVNLLVAFRKVRSSLDFSDCWSCIREEGGNGYFA